ncbi:MAG: hypothetical protein WCD89_20620 [Anaerocolumna sp.]
MIPVFGAVFDLANGIWYATEGNYIDMAFTFAGVIPVIGDFAQGSKLGYKAVKLTGEIVDVAGDAAKADNVLIGVLKSGGKVDFYVLPSGTAVPSTGYRYMSREANYIDNLKNTMEIPANPNGIYITFDKFDVPNPGKLQVPHDASIRGSFDTLQIIDDVRIPNGEWGVAEWLEPITKDYPIYGSGGATQAITNPKIILDSLTDLLK